MSIEKVRDFFGIKYVIPYNLTTKKPLVVLRAIGEISFENNVDAVELGGGHTDAPYDVEFGQPSPVLSGTVREYPKELFQLMETTTVTDGSAETSGGIGTPTNAQGTSVFRIPGITGITAHPSLLTSLPFGRLTLVAATATTLDAYFAGTGVDFSDITGLVASGISTTTTGSVQITALGLVLTVTGTVAYTVGDTMEVEIRPVNTGYTQIVVGQSAGTAPTNFGVRCVFPRKTDGVLHYIDIFNVSARGMSWKGVSREFSEFDISWKPQARASDGAVYEMVRVLGS